MNLYMDRFLVLIGGETQKVPANADDDQAQEAKDKVSNRGDLQLGNKEESNEGASKQDVQDEEWSQEDEDANSKSLNDVWVFDVFLNKWKEINPVVKVQPQFNSKR